MINEILNPKAGGHWYQVIVAMRDVCELLNADLNWLLTGNVIGPGTKQSDLPAAIEQAQSLSVEERQLIDQYRRTTKPGRHLLKHVAEFAAAELRGEAKAGHL